MHAAQRQLLMHASNALKTAGAQDGGGGEEDEGNLKRERGESKERARREGGSAALSPI